MEKQYQLIIVNGYNHVVTEYDRCSKVYPNPNYKNTGKALCGVLKQDETLEQWIARKK